MAHINKDVFNYMKDYIIKLSTTENELISMIILNQDDHTNDSNKQFSFFDYTFLKTNSKLSKYDFDLIKAKNQNKYEQILKEEKNKPILLKESLKYQDVEVKNLGFNETILNDQRIMERENEENENKRKVEEYKKKLKKIEEQKEKTKITGVEINENKFSGINIKQGPRVSIFANYREFDIFNNFQKYKPFGKDEKDRLDDLLNNLENKTVNVKSKEVGVLTHVSSSIFTTSLPSMPGRNITTSI